MNWSRPCESTTSSRLRVSEDGAVSVDKKKRSVAVLPAAAMDGKFFFDDDAAATLASREAAREDDANNVIASVVDIYVYSVLLFPPLLD